MAANLWRVYSAAVPTTGPMASVATGTATKTLVQWTPTVDMVIVGWGIAFETVPTAFVKAELINTTTVAGGTPTAVVPSNIQGNTAPPGTAGFAPATEGTVVATTRVFDHALLLGQYFYREFSLGREPILEAAQVVRVRATTTVTINAIAWIDFE